MMTSVIRRMMMTKEESERTKEIKERNLRVEVQRLRNCQRNSKKS